MEAKTSSIEVKCQTFMSMSDIVALFEKDKTLFTQGYPLTFYGFVRKVRLGGHDTIAFIDLYDGTISKDLMCIASKESYVGKDYKTDKEYLEHSDAKSFTTFSFDDILKLTTIGCSVCVDGVLTIPPPKEDSKNVHAIHLENCNQITDVELSYLKDVHVNQITDDGLSYLKDVHVRHQQARQQLFELNIKRFRMIGTVEDPKTFPIQKSNEKMVALLRQYPMHRMRASGMQSIFRICAKLDLAVSLFMDKKKVVKFDPNIITMSDCEGAGDTFKIAPLIFSHDSEGKDIPVGLTVSSQLPLEAGITGLNAVYTAQKSFRAEKSDTAKHLAEFYHVEFEKAFITLDQLIGFTEEFVKFLISYIHTNCTDDLAFLESQFGPSDVVSSRPLLTTLMSRPFSRIKHKDAIELIHHLVSTKYELPDETGKLKRVKLDKLPKQGEDISAEHEKLLVKYFGWISLSDEDKKEVLENKKEYGAFVFLTHWPLTIKSFYMKQCDDNSGECESFDLLAPRVGEMFGGSMREWRYEKLMTEVIRRKMDITPIKWFIDLRKSGSMPHGGWGMGFARLCMLITGAPSVRDVVPFPVYYTHCPY
jgi:asparaginyl-tRNA synthetase